VNAFIKLDESLHGVTVVILTNDREIPGSTPGRYNLHIKITSPLVKYNMGCESVPTRMGINPEEASPAAPGAPPVPVAPASLAAPGALVLIAFP